MLVTSDTIRKLHLIPGTSTVLALPLSLDICDDFIIHLTSGDVLMISAFSIMELWTWTVSALHFIIAWAPELI